MKSSQLTALIVIVAVVVALSGCICCCGLDSPLSKFKKSVTAIDFPDQITIGGKTYHKQFTHEHLTPDEAKQSIVNFAGKLGYDTSGLGDTANTLWGLAGVKEDKSFKYTGSGPNDIAGGSVAKTGAPSTASAGYTGIKQAAIAAMGQANDPSVNKGSVKNIVHEGSIGVGDEGDYGQATVDGKTCYVVVCRYSNMYVTAYSYDSPEAARQVAEFAIAQIDAAA
jgi:hypothetical protein